MHIRHPLDAGKAKRDLLDGLAPLCGNGFRFFRNKDAKVAGTLGADSVNSCMVGIGESLDGYNGMRVYVNDLTLGRLEFKHFRPPVSTVRVNANFPD